MTTARPMCRSIRCTIPVDYDDTTGLAEPRFGNSSSVEFIQHRVLTAHPAVAYLNKSIRIPDRLYSAHAMAVQETINN